MLLKVSFDFLALLGFLIGFHPVRPEMTLTYPSCSSSTIKKNGHIHNGKQNHQCLNCGKQFVIDPQQKIINEEKRALIRQALLERFSLGEVCRIFNVSMPWLLRYQIRKRFNYKKLESGQ